MLHNSIIVYIQSYSVIVYKYISKFTTMLQPPSESLSWFYYSLLEWGNINMIVASMQISQFTQFWHPIEW